MGRMIDNILICLWREEIRRDGGERVRREFGESVDGTTYTIDNRMNKIV
jgi:hypothetical protein